MKYYIPKIEDLFDGYEFEYQVHNREENEWITVWTHHKFNIQNSFDDNNIWKALIHGRVRVEYFNLQQLIPLGYTIKVNDKGTIS